MSCIHQDILQNLNIRYVLFKRSENDFSIVDKLKRVIISIDDPIINFPKLIEIMIDKKTQIFNDYKEFPEPIEKPISYTKNAQTLKIFIKKVYDENKNETGSIISAMTNKLITDYIEKRKIESLLEDYAFTVLYPYEGLNIYTNIYVDTVSITVIKNINDLPYKDIDPLEARIIDR